MCKQSGKVLCQQDERTWYFRDQREIKMVTLFSRSGCESLLRKMYMEQQFKLSK